MNDIREFAEPLRSTIPFRHPTLQRSSPWIRGNVHRMRTEDAPPVRWLVEGLIPAGVPGVLAGRANVGKSMTALLIGMALASGLDVMGRRVSSDARRGVVFVSLEDDQDEFHRRFSRCIALLENDPAWNSQCGSNLQARFLPVFPDRCSGAGFSLREQWPSLADLAAELPGGCGLIILDTLSRMAEGDENSASDMRALVDAASALVQSTGATVLSVHHVGKGNDTPSEKKLWQRLHPETMRGSSAIEAGARFVLTMATLSATEARSAGLDAEDALRGDFVAFHLAKMNAAERGHTAILQRRHAPEHGAGFLALHPESERILSVIQGEAAVLKRLKKEEVLLAIAEAGGLKALDQRLAADRLWPDSRNPKGQWDKMLTGLRQEGLLEDSRLTDPGWARAHRLGFDSSVRKS